MSVNENSHNIQPVPSAEFSSDVYQGIRNTLDNSSCWSRARAFRLLQGKSELPLRATTLFGLVTACSFLPMVVLSLLGGVLADRVNKPNIMVGLDFATALITIFYISLGKLPIVPLFIVLLMILYGISGTYQPAVQASIPLLV